MQSIDTKVGENPELEISEKELPDVIDKSIKEETEHLNSAPKLSDVKPDPLEPSVVAKKIPSVNELSEIGTEILRDDMIPARLTLEKIINTSVGMELFQVGLAKSQSPQLKRIFDCMDILEKDIFDPGAIESMGYYEKINLYRLAKESFEFRMRFMNQVQRMVNWQALNSEILKLMASDEEESPITGAGAEKAKQIRGILMNLINQSNGIDKEKV